MELKEMISEKGIQDVYGSYTLVDKSYYYYCISKKIDDEEEFLCCFNTFNKLDSMDVEKEKMYNILINYLNI